MIVDTSALLAVLFAEDDANYFASAMIESEARWISAANLLEAAIRVDNLGDDVASRKLDEFIVKADIGVAPVSAEQVSVARTAYRDYGKGNHPAGLNFGDCFAYALAKDFREPLLFKGNDFAQTDIKAWH